MRKGSVVAPAQRKHSIGEHLKVAKVVVYLCGDSDPRAIVPDVEGHPRVVAIFNKTALR